MRTRLSKVAKETVGHQCITLLVRVHIQPSIKALVESIPPHTHPQLTAARGVAEVRIVHLFNILRFPDIYFKKSNSYTQPNNGVLDDGPIEYHCHHLFQPDTLPKNYTTSCTLCSCPNDEQSVTAAVIVYHPCTEPSKCNNIIWAHTTATNALNAITMTDYTFRAGL